MTQLNLPFDALPEPFLASTRSEKARHQIDKSHSLVQWFRDQRADNRITTGDRIGEPKP